MSLRGLDFPSASNLDLYNLAALLTLTLNPTGFSVIKAYSVVALSNKAVSILTKAKTASNNLIATSTN